MYNQPYFIPGYFSSTTPSMMNGVMRMGNAMNRSMGIGNAMNGAKLASQSVGKGLGLFSRLGNSMRAIKGINWGGLITNASKTLNVVNQAIPLVRQVGPMVNNMKSMLKVASIFKDETDKKPTKQNNKTINNNEDISIRSNVVDNKNYNTNNIKDQNSYSNPLYEDNSPTFFVTS